MSNIKYQKIKIKNTNQKHKNIFAFLTRIFNLWFLIFGILCLIGVFSLTYLPKKYAVPILMYHSINEYSKIQKISVSPESFSRQMLFLKKHGYAVVPLEAIVSLLEKRKALPHKIIAITFDDGFDNNYTAAYPVLKKYGFPATIFMIVDNIGKQGYLTAGMLREMSQNNIDIGSHTLSQAFLPKLGEKDLLREMKDSKEKLQKILAKDVKFIAYPGGGFNAQVKEAAKQTGYAGAAATSPGLRYPNNDTYALKRVRVSRSSDNMFWFWLSASGYYTFIKEWRDED